MKIGCLQFAPLLGQVEKNIERANAILETASAARLDWLILPELAFTGEIRNDFFLPVLNALVITVSFGQEHQNQALQFMAKSIFLGYNFSSLEAITPFLEETTAGTTTRWAQSIARRLGCCVTVGYPEVTSSTPVKRYNSTVTVARNGSILINYRKTFLYYTDETWASEGEPRFFVGQLGELGLVAHGICMDINPYKFVAPWTEYEFAMRALGSSTPLVGLSMAGLTRLAPEELVMAPLEPDMETLTYWLERFHPFIERARPEPVIIVIANRCGREGDVCYAGSSAVVSIQRGEVRVHGLLGRFEEALLFVDSSSVSTP